MKRKIFITKANNINEEELTAEFVISDNKPDRAHEIVEQGFDTENFKNNPILLWGHRPDEPDNVIGNVLEIREEKAAEGIERTIAKVKFHEHHEKAKTIAKMVFAGVLRAVSIGFIPGDTEKKDGIPILKHNELLELSVVGIPANPRAVALAYEMGDLNKQDLDFLDDSVKSYQKQLKNIIKDAIIGGKETNMSDEDIKKISEALKTALGETLAPINEKLDKLAGQDEPEGEDEPDVAALDDKALKDFAEVFGDK